MTTRTFTPSPDNAQGVVDELRRKIDPLGRIEIGATDEDVRAATRDGHRPTVYVVQRHVSQSGMLRRLSLFVVNDNDAIENVTWDAAVAMGEKVTEHNGHFTLTVRGAGMDMHFATVYDLSRTLFENGYAIKHVTL